MAAVQKSVLVPYSAAQMYELVERIEDYPRFLPWCGGTTVLERTPAETLARVDINYHGVHAHFTTVNRKQPFERIVIELREGPFRNLDGVWRFRSLAPDGCSVALELHYEFKAHVLEPLIGPVFGRIAHTLVDSFVRRAEGVYG